jgi:hypothetical protein
MSSSKIVSSILMGIMVSRGLLKYDEKVATYWPEFAQHGKENIKVEDIMRHEGGMHKFDSLLNPEDEWLENIKNNSMGRAIENDRAAWFPGNPRKYHTISRDWISNEIFRRVDPEGRTMGEFMKSEFSQLGMEIICGMQESEYPAFKERLIPMKQLGLKVAISSMIKGSKTSETMFENFAEIKKELKSTKIEME